MLHRRRLLLYKHSQAEPNYDIMVWAESGYDGVVRVNGADFQLTQDTNNPQLWYSTAPSSVTSLDYFLKHDSRSNYNSTSVYVKKVKFGTGMYDKTASCTSLQNSFCCYNSSVASLRLIDVKNLNTSSLTNLNSTFGYCTTSYEGFKIVGCEDFNVSNVTDFRACFRTFIANEYLDLHKWRVSSSALAANIFAALFEEAGKGINYQIYYTPGYWTASLPESANHQLTVYPYHDINVAASSGFNGKIYYDGALVDMTYDSSLGIWYKDITTQISGNTLRGAFRASNNSTVADNLLSISLKEINAQDYSLDTFGFALGATSLRSADIEGLSGKISTVAYQMFRGDTSLSNVYLPEFGAGYGYSATFMSCSNLRYVEFKPNESASDYFANIFNGCTNLIRISNLPSIANSIDTSAAFTGCSALTTIDAAGPISETIDLSPCPLSLASAKVILSALQQVTSETISFSTATWMAINDDEEAVELLEEAYSKGWNSNEPDIVVIHDGAWSRKLRINNADVTISQYDSTHAYYSTINSSITTLIGMCKKVSGVTNYWDSTSTNIRYVRFGKNAYYHTANVTNLQQAFAARNTITNLKVDVTHLNTSKVTTFTSMFRADGTLTGTYYEIKGYENWDTSKATTMNLLFNNKFFKPGICDLHNWTVGSSCNISQMFPGVSDRVDNGNEYPVYFTPSKFKAPTWANNGNVTWKSFSPYPYHKVNVVYNGSEANHNIYDAALGQTVTLSYDSTNELYYYDDATTINGMFSSSNNSSTSNINFISVKLDSGNRNMAHAFEGCSNLVSVDFTMCKNLSGSNSLNSTFWNAALLQEVIGLNTVVEGSESYDVYYCALGAYNLRWFNTGEWNVAPNSDAKWLFACNSANPGTLRRIEYWPGIPSSVTNTEQLLLNQSTVTQIIAAGDQYKTLDLSTSPLDISSAKVILRALQTVTSETITFNSSTITAIQADNEAKQLVMLAIEKGWSIPGVNVELPSITNQTLYDIFYSGTEADNNVGVTINFTLNNPDGYEITDCGVCRAETINPSTPTATTTTDAGSKSVDVLDGAYNKTYYFRGYVTFNKYDGTSQTVYASDNLQSTEQYVLSRKSASGTSGTCSVRTNGTSATNIYVNVRCNCYPFDPYNSSNYSLKWELRRSSPTGTLIASGTASYVESLTAFYTHGNATMSNANTTKYAHYLIFYRSDDTAHKVYYVSDNTFAEQSTAAWILFHYSGKSY